MWENTGAGAEAEWNGGYPSQRSRRECERARDSRARPCDKDPWEGGRKEERGNRGRILVPVLAFFNSNSLSEAVPF